jgi:hypothetical protein
MLMYERTDEVDALLMDFAREVQRGTAAGTDEADPARVTAG